MTENSGDSPRPSRRRVLLGGGAILILGFGCDQGIRFLSNILLAKLLFPEAFGLLALSMAFITALNLFSDLGIRTAIIQNPRGDEPDFLNTAWTIQVIRGLTLWAISFALAWPAAYWRETPEPLLLIILPLLGLSAIFDGFGSTKLILLQRHMQQKRSVFFDLACQSVGVSVTLTWAMIEPSVWCLVAGPLTTSLFRCINSHLLLQGPGNRFRWDRSSVRELAHVAGWSYFGTICTFLSGQTDRLVIGIRSLAELGVYHFAASLAQIPVSLTYALSGRLLFPFYSREIQAGHRLESNWRGPHRIVGLFACLLVTGVAVTGPYLVRLIYDDRYQQAAFFLPLLCLGVWFQIFEGISSAILFAQRLNRLSALSNFSKVITLVLLVPPATYYHGTFGMIAAFICGDVVRYLFTSLAIRRRGIQVWSVDAPLALLAVIIYGLGYSSGRLAREHLPIDNPRLESALIFFGLGLLVVAFWALAYLVLFKVRKPQK